MTSQPNSDSFWQKLIKSKQFAWMINLPIIRHIVAWATGIVIAQRLNRAEDVPDEIVTDYPSLTITRFPKVAPQSDQFQLDYVVRSVVDDLGYVAAFLALYEQGDVLPIHAYRIQESLISRAEVEDIEERISTMLNQKMSLSDPTVARVKLYDEAHAVNLSIRAVKAGTPVIDRELFSLFTPIVPDASRPIFQGIQQRLGIQEVVAVPFTIEYYNTEADDSQLQITAESIGLSYSKEIVGNLFAVSTKKITAQDINVLRAFGYQAATAIQSSQYKKQSEVAGHLIQRLQRTSQSEKETFDQIVTVIVSQLGYFGAMISVTDTQNVLRVKAFDFAPEIYEDKSVADWQAILSDVTGIDGDAQSLDFLNFDLDEEDYRKNLGYVVMSTQSVMTTKSIYSLVRPMLPDSARPSLEETQRQMGIKRILAIPLFSYSSAQHTFADTNCIGVLYIASRSRGFTAQEIELLQSVGEQVGNAMIYSLSEKRRLASERFARMAFNANALLHDINGHIGAIGMALRFIDVPVPTQTEDEEEPHSEFLEMAKERIGIASELLQQLSEPFIDAPERMVRVDLCVQRAVEKLDLEMRSHNIALQIEMLNDIPEITGFREMLVQVFRIILKRAMDAIVSMDKSDGFINITMEYHQDAHDVLVTFIDNGHAMTQDELAKVFDIHENQQDTLIGFGMFWANDYILGMGGDIKIESVSHEGTRIQVQIPAREHITRPQTTQPQH